VAPKNKKARVRHQVAKGDVVRFHAPMEHYSGFMGVVVSVPAKDYVVVRTVGSRYEQYTGSLWVVYTEKPRGMNKASGEKNHVHRAWIKKVVFRKTDYVPKPSKPKVHPRVLRTPEQLQQHLASNSTEKVVYMPLAADKEDKAA
jgi:hypothetical protein